MTRGRAALGVNQHGVFKLLRVGSGRVKECNKSHASGPVKIIRIVQVGSGPVRSFEVSGVALGFRQETRKSSLIGSGQVEG